MNVVDGCAGPGGFDLGARMLGIDPIGFEWDAAACATRTAAGLRTVRADVTQIDPTRMAGKIDGLLFSPPCQAFSMAGKGAGRRDLPLVWQALDDIARGVDRLAELTARAVDPRSLVVAQPLRWALAALPEWMVWEQVPPVLAVWETCALALRGAGYEVWTGVLNATDYGVPQTRQRAFLLARRGGPVAPPAPTHTRDPWGVDLFGGAAPERWVSMADALGDDSPAAAPTDWYLRTEQLSDTAAGRIPIERRGDQPAPTLVANADRWELRVGVQTNASARPICEPAPTLFFGHHANEARWHRSDAAEDSVRITMRQAAILQGFPVDHPFRGTKTARFRQVGDAVPPLLAAHCIAAAAGIELPTARHLVKAGDAHE